MPVVHFRLSRFHRARVYSLTPSVVCKWKLRRGNIMKWFIRIFSQYKNWSSRIQFTYEWKRMHFTREHDIYAHDGDIFIPFSQKWINFKYPWLWLIRFLRALVFESMVCFWGWWIRVRCDLYIGARVSGATLSRDAQIIEQWLANVRQLCQIFSNEYSVCSLAYISAFIYSRCICYTLFDFT